MMGVHLQPLFSTPIIIIMMLDIRFRLNHTPLIYMMYLGKFGHILKI